MNTRHALFATLTRERKPERMTVTDRVDALGQAMRCWAIAAFTALRGP